MAIALDNSSSAVSLTVAHTITGSGNDRLLMAFFHGASGSATGSQMTACTYDGTSADGSIVVEATRYGNSYSITAFYWLEDSLPTNSGSYNCVATAGSGQWNRAGYTASFTGVNQVTPTIASNFDDAPSSGDNSSVSITTPDDNSVICDASGFWGTNVGAITPESGQTELGEVSQNGQANMAVGWESIATEGSNTQEWSSATSEQSWQAIAFAFAPSDGAVTPKYNMLAHNF